MTTIGTMGPDFSGNYDHGHAQYYFDKHRQGLWRRLSNWREVALARRALRLAGNPSSVLDVPCGNGRFWEVLAEDPGRAIHAVDNSQAMIDVGLARRPPTVVARVRAFRASAFALPLPEGFAECVFCSRFMHHLGRAEDRIRLLGELRRVSRDSVIVSLWTDGNLQSARRMARDARRSNPPPSQRLVIPAATVEAEFAACGLTVVGRLDFLPWCHMLRTYVLRQGHQVGGAASVSR